MTEHSPLPIAATKQEADPADMGTFRFEDAAGNYLFTMYGTASIPPQWVADCINAHADLVKTLKQARPYVNSYDFNAGAKLVLKRIDEALRKAGANDTD